MNSDLEAPVEPLIASEVLMVPGPHSSPGIYWLQTALTAAGGVVIITDVAGNLGQSVYNDIEHICRYLAGTRSLPSTITWINSSQPELSPHGAEKFSRVTFATEFSEPAWSTISAPSLCAMFGARVPALPDDLLEQVLAAGGGFHAEPRPTYSVVNVADLPLQHGMYQCAHAQRFNDLLAAHRQNEKAAATEFFATLSDADRDACPYHLPGWKVIADRAVAIIGELGPVPSDESIEQGVWVAGSLSDSERGWLSTLFGSQALVASRHGFTNGQHRGCAIRFSGAKQIVVAD